MFDIVDKFRTLVSLVTIISTAFEFIRR